MGSFQVPGPSAPLPLMRSGRPWERSFPELPFALLLSLLAATVRSEVRLEFSGDLPISGGQGFRELRARPCNETPSHSLVKGWRFKTPSFGGWKAIYYGHPSVAGTGPFTYTQTVPGYDENLPPGLCTPAPAQYYAPVPPGQDANPYDPQVLIKGGSCSEPPSVRDAEPVACRDIAGLLADPAYHDPGRCILDTLGTGGADNAGSLTASYYGQTQIQAAVPPEYLLVYGWEMRWDPGSLGGPLYMMALAMGQEYLGMNRQWLQTIAGKESNFGYVAKAFPDRGSISEWANGNVDQDGSWLPWQVLTSYFSNLIHSYPDYFPAHACAAGFPGPMSAAACVGGWEQAIAHYARTPGVSPSKTGPNSPQLANAVFAVSLAYYWIYDALWRATDLCYADAVRNGKDKRVALGGIMPLYADGIYSDVTPLKARNLKDNPDAFHTIRPGPSADYRDNVFYMLDAFRKANNQSQACGGTVPVYDSPIAWEETQRFFFGGSATPGTPERQGDGGLLLHFDLSVAERGRLLADLRCAFDRLRGKAPSVRGQDAISYRYDWLTVLRAAKGRLPLARKLPAQTEWNNWIKDRSVQPVTCAGGPRDTAFPGLAILSPPQGSLVKPGFQVTFEATDDWEVRMGEWNLDRSWRDWQPASPIGSGRFRFQVPCAAPGLPVPGNPGTLWIRAGDGCGNHVHQQLDFHLDTSSACLPAKPDTLKPKDPIRDTVRPNPISRDTLKPDPPFRDTLMPKGPIRDTLVRGPALPATGPAEFRVTFPNGSADRAVPGAGLKADHRVIFIPVDATGRPLAGSRPERCESCAVGGNLLFTGPVFHILASGPLEYDLRVFTTQGQLVAKGSGSIRQEDLPRLLRRGDGSLARYEARIVWTGGTIRGGRAGTGAYIAMAILKSRPSGTGSKHKVLFGYLRGND